MKMRVRVVRRVWTSPTTGEEQDSILIHSNGGFAVIPFDKARRVVDAVHDLCDEHDRELRERNDRDYHPV
ncbi:hypothetical protein SAMN04488565_2733 [Leucobacter chromiiresistens]|uniref:Uncharacterized protein n=1 Tax=Leucobacter chromiiresistens TaxID=1079994 RepID=A0A1H1BCM8_9MICO|nr:hypothetical protein SAMN04488565_2733 [Leucobacter chromiiresistens]